MKSAPSPPLDDLVEAAGVGLCLLDPAGRVLHANEEWLRSVGLTRGGALGADVWELFPATPPELRRLHDDVRRGLTMKVPAHAQRVAGGTVWFEGSLSPVPLAGGVGILITAIDITERKRAEESLRTADARKSEFLAVLSHELRNPLAPIRNSLAVLAKAPPGSPVAGRALEVLNRQADHLTRLIDDLLDVTRIERGKIELQRSTVDLREVVRRACADARGLFDQRGVALAASTPDAPTWVDADAARIAQLVGNLLANALKFTPAGGRVHVAVRARGASCEVSVRDTGVGIEPADLERIFQPFFQAERTRHAGAGLGIGLSLVRELAIRHGGEVRAVSAGADTGAEVVVELPCAAPPEAAPTPPRGLTTAAPLDVLIVEDNDDAATSLADMLALAGHGARISGDGQGGVTAFAAHPPDLLICDLGLPDLSGLDVIRAVRALPDGASAYAVALTGYAQPRDEAQALAAGFDAHLGKPADLDALKAVLAEAARRKLARP